MEDAINPYKTIRKAKVKSLLASQGVYIIYQAIAIVLMGKLKSYSKNVFC